MTFLAIYLMFRLFLDTLWMELDNGGYCHRCTNGGNATIGGPADHSRVRGKRVDDRSADAFR